MTTPEDGYIIFCFLLVNVSVFKCHGLFFNSIFFFMNVLQVMMFPC